MNAPSHKWAKTIYDNMMANTWFPSEIDTSDEKKNFAILSNDEKEIYKKEFAQLSFNDSAQAQYLRDLMQETNNSMIKAALTVQAQQEVNHSHSYAVLLDACGNSEEVFNMYRTDDMLSEKNESIADQFGRYISGKSVDEFLLSSVASIGLEGIYFMTGFGYLYVLGDKVSGARDMIKFIARDEIKTHLPLFVNIYKTIVKENKIQNKTYDKAEKMIAEAVDIEKKYALGLIENYPILGMTKEIVVNTVENYANDRLRLIGMEPMFEGHDTTYLQKLVKKHENLNTIKTNFFEGNNTNYSKGSLNMNDF